MRRFLLVVAATLLFATSVQAAQESVTVEWTYSAGVTNLAGFRIYQDGKLLSTVSDPATRRHTMALEVTTATLSFTMTAFFSDGSESSHSPVKTVYAHTPTNLRVNPLP